MGAVRHKRICARRAFRDSQYVWLWVLLLSSQVLIALNLTGCASVGRSNSEEKTQSKRMRELQSQLKRQQAKLESLKERNLVLEQRMQLSGLRSSRNHSVPVPFDPSAAGEFAESSERASLSKPPTELNPQLKAQAKSQLNSKVNSSLNSGVSFQPNSRQSSKPKSWSISSEISIDVEKVGTPETGEHFLYSKAIGSYRSRNAIELERTIQLLKKTYPDSAFTDNALYLLGLLAVESGETEKSAEIMDRVLKEYPHSNKAVTALFTKAVIARKQNDLQQARRLFHQVSARYPGSPEARRVQVELKIINSELGRKREI